MGSDGGGERLANLAGRPLMEEFPKRGSIYLVKLPNMPSDRKPRPALVVSLDIRNRLAGDVIVVPLTTTLRSAPTHVELAAGEGGLHETSMVKCEQITTLDKGLLLHGPFAERISGPQMRAVERAIMRAIGVPA